MIRKKSKRQSSNLSDWPASKLPIKKKCPAINRASPTTMINSQYLVNDSAIPPYIQKQLDEGPPGKGSRHEWLKELSLQMVGERIPDDTIFDILRAKVPDRDKPDSEFWSLIKGAHERNPQPATAATPRAPGQPRPRVFDKITKKEEGGFVIKTFKRQSLHLEGIPKLDVSIEGFLEKMFRPGETICICLDSYAPEGTNKYIPADSGHFATLEKWKEQLAKRPHLEKIYEEQAGVWLRVNPIRDGDTSGSDDSVTDFRNVLVEFDSLPKSDQWDIYKQSGLPIAAVTDSGGKSLHALVKVDAKNLEEYRERQKRVYDFLSEYLDDKGNGNPSRFSRLPGVTRAGQPQHVVAFDVGASNWHEWENTLEEDHDLPEIETPEDIDVELPLSDPIIEGVIREQSKMALSSNSKGRKSWMLIALGLCVGSGTDWLGFKCVKSKVLYLNFELKKSTFRARVKVIKQALGITSNQMNAMHLRGKARDITDLVRQTKRMILKGGYKLVILDPMYKCLGWRDENSARDMTDYANNLEVWLTESLVSVIFTGHFTKGDSSTKQGNDRQSGSGVLARDPDVVSNFLLEPTKSKIEKTDVVTVEFSGMREDPPIPSFYAKWDFPVFSRMTGTVTQEIKKNARLEFNDMLDCLDNEGGGKTSPGGWLEVYNERFCPEKPMSLKVFRERRKSLRDSKLLKEDGSTQKCVCKIAENAYKDDETGNWMTRMPSLTKKVL
jgi:RecA-family ATPase